MIFANTKIREDVHLQLGYHKQLLSKYYVELFCRFSFCPHINSKSTNTSGFHPSVQCPVCAFTMDPTSEVVGQVTGYRHTITDNVDCQTKNVIYYWKCCKPNCPDHPYTEYIGKTSLSFQKRFSQHRDYVKRDQNEEPSGAHFNLVPGHSVSDIKGLVLEHCKS